MRQIRLQRSLGQMLRSHGKCFALQAIAQDLRIAMIQELPVMQQKNLVATFRLIEIRRA
jgi:hypothetical protein